MIGSLFFLLDPIVFYWSLPCFLVDPPSSLFVSPLLSIGFFFAFCWLPLRSSIGFLFGFPLCSIGSPFVLLLGSSLVPLCVILAPPSFFYWVPLWFPLVLYWLPLCSSIGIPSLSGVAGRYLLDLRRPPVNTTGGATPSNSTSER